MNNTDEQQLNNYIYNDIVSNIFPNLDIEEKFFITQKIL